MKAETRKKIETGIQLGLLIFIILLAVVVATSAGCSTVTPKQVRSESPSYDGNDQNSGIIVSTKDGFLVTPRFHIRYNALIEVYGRDFTPPLHEEEGIAKVDANTYLIDKQHMTQFLEMDAWLRAGLHPLHQ